MKNFVSTTLIAAAMVLVAGSVAAQDMKKDMPKDGMKMTMEQCKDHMANTKKGGTAKDDMSTKKDAACAEMMAKKDPMMKKDGAAADPMKK